MKVSGINIRSSIVVAFLLSTLLLLDVATARADGSWLGSAWRFRVPVSVSVGAYDRFDMPAEVQLNFTQLMSGLGFSGTFLENSLRVVEVDGTGNIIDTTVAWQFDKDSDYSASSKASGTIIIIAKGTTTAGSTRTYHVYFHGGSGSFQPAQVTAQVTLTDNIQDEGQACFQIQAGGNTYFFQKQGGGFSSLVDANNNDWIGFHPQSGSGGDGEWRGIPNCGYAFHPGYGNSTSNIIHTGPVKAAFRAVGVSASGKTYEALWEVYPRFARMTMVRADSNYWFLYEGTPGGGTDPATLFMYKSDGTQTYLTQSWNGDIAANEWAYFSNPNEISGGRSIFVAHAEDDAATDTYWPMYPPAWPNGHMTVFGFGRDNPGDHWLLTGAPQHFTVGLMDGTQFSSCSKIVYGSYKPMTVVAGSPEQQLMSAPMTVYPDTGASGLPTTVQLAWTRVAGISSYRVQVGLDSTLTSALEFDNSAIVDSTVSVSNLNEGAVHFWRVNATGSGVTGPWSPIGYFRTALSSPALSGPANGSTDVPLNLTLNWVSVPHAVAYRLQVSTDPTFAGGLLVDEWNSGETSRALPTLAEATTYYWRVAARSAQAIVSNFSSPWQFRTTQVVVAPTALQPLNGATGLATSELFRWMRATGAVSYHLQVALDSTFATGFVKNDSTITDTSRTVIGLAKGTKYFWRIRAKFGTTNGPWSLTWWFRTAYQLPSQPVLVSPPQMGPIGTDTVSFVWNRAQPNVTRYWLEVGMDSAFSFSLLDTNIVDTTGKVYIPVRLRWYYWRVRGENAGGWGTFSDVQIFYALKTGVSRENGLPRELSLEQNYPNPFNPSTRIRFAVPSEKQVRIEVYSVLGERVATLVDERLGAGVYTVEMDGARLPSGVYYYRLVTAESSITKKMLLVK